MIVPPNQPRYLFLLDSRIIGNTKTVVRGIRQGLTIGINQSSSEAQSLIYEFPVTSPWWRFPDGNVSWHLVREPNDTLQINHPERNRRASANWCYLESNTPAMLFQDFTNSNVNPSTGAPLFYNVGLTAYTPPTFSASRYKPVGNLGNMKGIYYPWEPHSDNCLYFPVSGPAKISLYASVLQTNPLTRLQPESLTAADVISGGISNEDAFVFNFTSGGGESPLLSPIYWRIFGSILFDDAYGAD